MYWPENEVLRDKLMNIDKGTSIHSEVGTKATRSEWLSQGLCNYVCVTYDSLFSIIINNYTNFTQDVLWTTCTLLANYIVLEDESWTSAMKCTQC